MMRCSLAITVLITLAAWHPAEARPPVIHLEAQNFEAYTQAATGQTTGTWFVLFTSSHEPSLQHLGQAWEDLGASQLAEPQQVIYAAVDVADEPDLAERFGITSLPTFLLFRDRKMYKYAGAESGPEELRSFSLAGYKQARPLPVPAEPTVFDTMLRALKRSGWTLRAVEAAAGCLIAALVLVLVVSLKQGSTAPTGQPAAVGQKGPDSDEKIPAVRGNASRRSGKES